jgi:hypothetical protein
MITTLTTLIDRLDRGAVAEDVLSWGCPVPAFGDLANSKIATLGINPSNREFVDAAGNELDGAQRRFPTLNSLGLASWSHTHATHLESIIDSCRSYFFRNPYNSWFQRLDYVIADAGASYYCASSAACHLDLIPYATGRKWTELPYRQKSELLAAAGDTLGLLLYESRVQLLVLNGRSVIEGFQELAGVRLAAEEITAWNLSRNSVDHVKGIAYSGIIDTLSGIPLGRSIQVLGFNHNLQSSFGVTKEVMKSIREWVSSAAQEDTSETT